MNYEEWIATRYGKISHSEAKIESVGVHVASVVVMDGIATGMGYTRLQATMDLYEDLRTGPIEAPLEFYWRNRREQLKPTTIRRAIASNSDDPASCLITQETASIIWHCYREIEVAEELLNEMAKQPTHFAGEHPESISKTFDRQPCYQLGVPSGVSSHRLYHVNPKLAEQIVKAHIESKKDELQTAMIAARRELGL